MPLPHLPEVLAVTLIVDPPPAIVAIRDIIIEYKLGLEELLSSLGGHLANHHWPLEVYLLKRKFTFEGEKQKVAHMHAYICKHTYKRT